MKSSHKFQGWEAKVKITCEITQDSLVDVCADFCESLVIWIIFFFPLQDSTAHAYINMLIGNVNNRLKLTLNGNVC